VRSSGGRTVLFGGHYGQSSVCGRIRCGQAGSAQRKPEKGVQFGILFAVQIFFGVIFTWGAIAFLGPAIDTLEKRARPRLYVFHSYTRCFRLRCASGSLMKNLR
jgi:hypothetical protein